MPFSSAQQWVGLAVETVRGTGVAPTVTIPVKSPQWTPNITMIDDQGLRGSMVDMYDQIAGLRHDEMDFSCAVYMDTVGHLIRGVLGSTDTVTGTAAPYTHTIGLLNNAAATGSQPPSYTITYFNGNEGIQMAAGQADSLNLKFNATALLDATVKYMTNPATIVASPVEAALGTIEAAPSWNCVASIGGTTITKTMDGEIDLKRNVKPIEAITGTQSPYRLWAGPLQTSGKLTLVYESDTELQYYLSNTKGEALDLKFSDPSNADSIDFHLSTPAFKTGKINPGKDWIEVDLEFVGLPNSTDAVAGGVSPIKVQILNSQSTAY